MGGALSASKKKPEVIEVPPAPVVLESSKPPVPEQQSQLTPAATAEGDASVPKTSSDAPVCTASVDATQSIFDRLHDWFEQAHGNTDEASSAGELAIVALVETFYRKVLADPRLYPFFQGVSMEILRRHQFEFLRNVLSRGTFKYTGKPIRIGHTRLFDKGLDETHFDMVADHLVSSMKDISLPEDIIKDIVAAVLPLRPIFEDEARKRRTR